MEARFRRGRPFRPLLALGVAAALLGSLLAGCGGGGSDTDGSSSATAPQASTQSPQEKSPATSGRHRGEGQSEKAHYEGSEEKVESSGIEAEGSERAAVLAAEHGYLAAIAGHRYAAACSLVSRLIAQQLQAMVPAGAGSKSCAQVVSHLVAGSSAQVAARQLGGHVVRVRLEGDHGIVIFHAPGARLYAFPMSREGGSWRVGAINAAVLAPSAATLGER